MSASVQSPVHVDADLDPRLSRWLWLVKWLLAVPHYIVLVFLWIAFVVTSLVALGGILVTGRYPRTLFDFNVGVLRWSWRVAFYAYGALGTDQYPPFSLHDVPSYPARLEIDYPERLSRGLVLVKWWLLAIPHYVVLALFLGGAGYAVSASDNRVLNSGGLIGFLVLVAGVVLLFTGQYPTRLFDLVLGLNRWVLRVAAYVALMTDTYPPFALDQGGHDPGLGGPDLTPPAGRGPGTGTAAALVGGPSAAGAGPGGRPGGWTGGRVVSLVAGCLVALLALGLTVSAVTLFAADHAGRDSDGFIDSPSVLVTTGGYAVTTEDVRLHTSDSGAERFWPRRLLGDVQVTATGTRSTAVFVGVARSRDVATYLDGVRRCVLTGTDARRGTCEDVGTGAPATPPADAGIWSAQASGTGRQSMTWSPRQGDWTVVVMNADGGPAPRAVVHVGAELPVLGWVVGALAVLAAVCAVAATLLVAVPVRGARDVHRTPVSSVGVSGAATGR